MGKEANKTPAMDKKARLNAALAFIDRFNSVAYTYESSTGDCTRELARAILSHPRVAQAGAPGTVVLDNACGTAIVAEEIIYQHRNDEVSETVAPAVIYAVDPAPNMVAIAQGKLEIMTGSEAQNRAPINFMTKVMAGERLEFDDNTFTHSITNLGILFFQDGMTGATELRRTLVPGGVAVVTSWQDLGYFDTVFKPAHSEMRPRDPPLNLPISADWFSASYLKLLLECAGFHDVQVSTRKVHHGAQTLEKLVDSLMGTSCAVWKNWSDADVRKFRGHVREMATPLAERYIMPDGNPGFGIPMKASVAVCFKW